MTDAEVVKIARRMDRLLREVQNLCEDIESSDHPNAAELTNALQENYIPVMAWPTHCISDALEHPEQWECGDYGIRHKVATKAVSSRKRRK